MILNQLCRVGAVLVAWVAAGGDGGAAGHQSELPPVSVRREEGGFQGKRVVKNSSLCHHWKQLGVMEGK